MANNGKWSGRLARVEDRIEALEQINVQRGVSKPEQTDQAKAIRFICRQSGGIGGID
jgi:hypothetical protein